jgi:hypothetical protein
MIENESVLPVIGSAEHVARVMSRVEAMEQKTDCSRYIATELEECLAEATRYIKGVDSGPESARRLFLRIDGLARASRRQHDETGGRWISVGERLPDELRKVWVHRRLYGEGQVAWIEGGEWWTSLCSKTRDVTHWMPFPKPPC